MAKPRILWGEGMEQFEDGARFLKAEVIEGGKAVGILLQEDNGQISSVRLDVEQLAD
jgi:hypothetical protein